MFSTIVSILAEETKNNLPTTIIIIIMLVAVVGLMIFNSRSNKKRQKQAQELKDKIRPGDTVRSIGGIIGKVVSVDEELNAIVIDTAGSHIAINREDVYPIEAFQQQGAVSSKTEEAPAEEVFDETAANDEITESKEEAGEEAPEISTEIPSVTTDDLPEVSIDDDKKD